jgi:CDP-diacylglycerol---glycerol-3-phosphate 3-phosphatidyltransferase
MLLTLPNFVSFLRFPLALLFLYNNPAIRLFAIITAMLSDGLDGYLARRNKIKNKVGVMLDPLADKFFVLFVAVTLISEGKLELWQVVALGCRDISVLLFGCYLVAAKKLFYYEFRAIRCGKITTFLQFIVLIALTLNITIPAPFYIAFILLGILSLVELALPKNEKGRNSKQ